MKYFILFFIQVLCIGFVNAQWTVHQLETTNDLVSLNFINANTGFLGGFGLNTTKDNSILYKTTDGGINWNRIQIIGPKTIEDIYFVNDKTGYLLTFGSNKYMYKTTDGGATWLTTTLEQNTFEFSEDGLGFIFYDQGTPSFSKRTFDYGKTWEPYGRDFDLLSYNYVSAVDFLDNQSSVVYALADGGEVYKSTDKGDSWVKIRPSDQHLYYDIEFVSETTGYIVGRDNVLKTDDGGANWSSVLDANSEEGELIIIDENEFLLMTRFGIYHTTNQWNTHTYSSAPPELLNGYLNAIEQIDESTFYIAADEGYVFKFDLNKISAIPNFASGTNLFSMYPNPTNGSVRLTTVQQGVFELHNLTGKLIYFEEVKNEKEIDLSSFSKGYYLASFTNETTNQTTKLLIE